MIEKILNERQGTNGDFPKVAAAFQGMRPNVRLEDEVLDFAVLNILAKIARMKSGNERFVDHWQDIAGYATFGSLLPALANISIISCVTSAILIISVQNNIVSTKSLV